jgi:hypothetical protein
MIHLKHEDCLNFFSDILNVLSSTNQHEEVFHLVVDKIVRIFKCQTCAIIIVDPATETAFPTRSQRNSDANLRPGLSAGCSGPGIPS